MCPSRLDCLVAFNFLHGITLKMPIQRIALIGQHCILNYHKQLDTHNYPVRSTPIPMEDHNHFLLIPTVWPKKSTIKALRSSVWQIWSQILDQRYRKRTLIVGRRLQKQCAQHHSLLVVDFMKEGSLSLAADLIKNILMDNFLCVIRNMKCKRLRKYITCG